MNKPRGRWLLALFLGLPILLLAACDVNDVQASWAPEKGSFDRKLSTSGPVELAIQSGSGEIHVHSGLAGAVSIHAEIRVRGNDAADKIRRLEQNPPVVQTGDVIQIGKISDEDLRRHVSISYDVTVPAETRVDAQTGSGGIEVAGIKGPVSAKTGSGGINVTDVAGEVRASTGSGSIKLEDAGGSVTAHTGSGSIHGARLGMTDVKDVAVINAETGSGEVSLNRVRGSVRAHTGSGGIKIDGEPAGNWEARSGSGGIHLRLPSKAAFELRADTGSGGISVDYPLTQQHASTDKHHLEGTVGAGGPRIELHTGSGGVHVEPSGGGAL